MSRRSFPKGSRTLFRDQKILGPVVTGGAIGGIIPPNHLGSGTATLTTYLRGDGVWAEIAGVGGTTTYSHVHSAGDLTSGIILPSLLGSGVPSNTVFLRGDGQWIAISGSGDGSLSSHQLLSDLQGGAVSEYYHLTSAQWQGVVSGAWASATHTHAYESLYAPLTHTHSYTAVYASIGHTHITADILSGIFDRTFLGSLSASTNSFLRGTGEWTTIGWASATHTHSAGDITNGTIATARLGSGTADNSTYLRGDQTWATPAGSGAYIDRATTATFTCGSFITYQSLPVDQIASQSNSATIMFRTLAVGAGTWNFAYHIIYQSAATTTGLGLSVNHSGASPGHFVSRSTFPSTGGAAATGVADQVQSSQTAGLIEAKAERALNTRSSYTVGVDTASANCYIVHSGILVVANTGSLDLQVVSEINGSNIHVKAGSHLILSKIN